jgi:hypothetical protein
MRSGGIARSKGSISVTAIKLTTENRAKTHNVYYTHAVTVLPSAIVKP